MQYLEETLSDLRAKVYDDFKEIIRTKSDCSSLSCDLSPILWPGDQTRESCYFACELIHVDEDGHLSFLDGDFCLNESEIDTDDIIYLHDQLVADYDLNEPWSEI